ncbi:MAG: DMT family transporter [Acidimicrobiales bacterium]
MVYLLAAATALISSIDSILQRMGVENAPAESTLRLGLLAYAVKQRVWLFGMALIIGSFLLQATALHLGNLSQVQPILVTELVFLVLILAVWFGVNIGRREWLGCVAASAGLAGFLVFAEPSRGAGVPTDLGWITVAAVCGGVVALTVTLALRGPRWWRATMFATAGAVGFALTASFIKVVSDYVTTDWVHMFSHWQTYGLALCGAGSLFLAQNAFHAGPVTASQTAAVLVNPLASLAIGIGLFGDSLRTTGVFGPLEAVSLVVMLVGAATVASSSVVAGITGDDEHAGELLSVRRPKRAGAMR